MIPVELSRIVIRDMSDQQYIYVSEKNGNRSFPIVIGIFEAMEIQRKISGITTPRPMTHDLVRRIIEALGAELMKLVINDLKDGTFYAELHLNQGGKEILVDCRPSDAIALSAASGTPIFVEEHVMDLVGKEEEGESDSGSGEDLFS